MDEYTVKVIVAAHKPYDMPDDKMYLPIHVGAAKKKSIGYQRDDEGDNISTLNPYFCELTGLYWAWKNLPEDYIGLVHYRRRFAMNGRTMKLDQLKPYLGKIKIFTPKKRWYVIETLKSHYEHTHYPEHIEVTRKVIMDKHPDYIGSFDKVLKRRWGYMFNMMIAERGILNNYCEWLFDVLFSVFEKIDISEYSSFEKRYIGRISELLFNVWLQEAIITGSIRDDEIMELDVDVKENVAVKIPAFLKAKFLRKRYDRSF